MAKEWTLIMSSKCKYYVGFNAHLGERESQPFKKVTCSPVDRRSF